jgi:hypothetical protein
VSLEEYPADPAIDGTCAECGVRLTSREIEASLESDGPLLCTVHASEQFPLDDEDEPEP